MGESRPVSGFGELDLDLEGGDESSPKPFGVVELELELEGEGEPPPASTARPGASRATLRKDADVPDEAKRPTSPPKSRRPRQDDEATRIVAGDAISSLTRASLRPGLDDEPASSPSSPSAQSESGIATRDARVAAMRDLYARGDADGALALANHIASERPQAHVPGHARAGGHGHSADHPDASLYIETGEVELDDSLGGLIPIDEGTVQVIVGADVSTEAAVRGMLTLTERQSIPRVLKSAAEIAKLPIDPRGGFLLAQVDGMQTLEEILDVCAMPAAEALDVIEQLKSLGAIEFE
jgi:hypothetical protein